LLFFTFSCPNQGFIRTRVALVHLLVSESGVHSDTDCSFSPFGVRIRGSFGHGLLFLDFSCPNQGFIRTRIALFHLFVSESRVHSDTDCSFSPFRVRIKGSFGHGLLFFTFSCPSQGFIRTRVALVHLLVSESGVHSDTDCSFSPFGVRIRGSFGHGLLFLDFSCPNQGFIRTRIAPFNLFVSELVAHSDTDCSF
jgi:hypothetical protein